MRLPVLQGTEAVASLIGLWFSLHIPCVNFQVSTKKSRPTYFIFVCSNPLSLWNRNYTVQDVVSCYFILRGLLNPICTHIQESVYISNPLFLVCHTMNYKNMCFYIFVFVFMCYEEGRAIAQAVSCWLSTAEDRVRAQVWSSGICGGQSGAGAGFLRVLWFLLPVLIPPTAPHSSSLVRGWYNRPVSGRRTKWTQSHPISLH
jgi:hypothetical protein